MEEYVLSPSTVSGRVCGRPAGRPTRSWSSSGSSIGESLVWPGAIRLTRGVSAPSTSWGIFVLNLSSGEVDTSTPMGSMVFTVMAALAQIETEIKREWITDLLIKRRAVGRDLGGRRAQFTDSQVHNRWPLERPSRLAPPGVAKAP